MITLLNRFDDNYVIQKEDVLDITSKYIRDNNLSRLVKDIVISDENIIKYNIDDILETNERLFQQLQRENDIDNKYTTYYLNYFYLKQIYEVLNHISQKANYDGKEDIRGFLYDLCQTVSMDDKNRDLLPMEIEASNEGLLTAFNYLNYTKLPGKEKERIHLEYLKKLLLNYNRKNNFQTASPIEVLNEIFPIVDMKELNILLDKSRLSKIDRLNLGLPITTKEYDSIQNTISKKLIKAKQNN
mgnify:CR=1 FL=1